MKILQVSNRVPWPLNEGGTIGIYNYTRAYAHLGHEVTLFCLDGIKHNTPVEEAKKELSKYAEVFIHPIDTDIYKSEALRHLLRNESYNVSRFYNQVFESEIADLLTREQFDIIQLEGTFTGPYMDIIKENFDGPVALRMHNVEYEIWERLAANEKNPLKATYQNILSKQLKRYESQLIKKADIIVTVTDDDGQKFEKLHPRGNYLTIPAGIDLDRWQYKPAEDIHSWYHIGSMEWHANKEAVLWYMDSIHQKVATIDAKYQLKLAGKGIGKLDIQGEQVQVTDYVENAIDFVSENDVCIVPLKSGSGIRLKILEAMAAGKLVISTTVGAQGIAYQKDVHLLIADSPEDYAKIYKSLLNGKIDFKKIVSNARTLIEDSYSTSALAKKQLEIYKAL